MSKNKHQDLQPWLDYFKMLQRYEQKCFLEIKPQEHEAYITRAALLKLAGIDTEDVQSAAISSQPKALSDATRKLRACTDVARRLRAYAGWKAAAADPSAISHQPSYISAPFATHIVKEEYPHDLLLTLLLQQKRLWYGRMKDVIEVIDYTENLNNN